MFAISNWFWRAWRRALALALWFGANCVALAWIDIYESRGLEAEFGVPASVIGCYVSRTAGVPLLLSAAAGHTNSKRRRGRRTIPSLALRVGMGCLIAGRGQHYSESGGRMSLTAPPQSPRERGEVSVKAHRERGEVSVKAHRERGEASAKAHRERGEASIRAGWKPAPRGAFLPGRQVNKFTRPPLPPLAKGGE